MGEGKAKALKWRRQRLLSCEMPQARFNLMAIGTRMSPTALMSEELSYWSDHEERLLGLVFRDRTDNDFGWILLARDKIGRFRCVDIEINLRSPAYAAQGVRQRIADAIELDEIPALADQGDETNYPTDLLAVPVGTKPQDLHPHFRLLMEAPGRAPARAAFREIGPWLAPADPHFVREFQFSQFDQRLWELYLWASFREMGFDVRQPEAPDFFCSRPGLQFTVEATTVTASQQGPLASHPNPQTPEEMEAFLADYMPMKFGSSLTSKLNKKDSEGRSYWERGDAAKIPFVIGIADFHIPGGDGEVGSMTYTQSALWPYLYGHRVSYEIVDGQLVTKAQKGEDHVFGEKLVPTGFFDLPRAENISGVLFSNAGTLSKFDRMGVGAGFGDPNHRYFRMGVRLDPDPNTVHGVRFMEEIEVNHDERWGDELQFFHNPKAKNPMPRYALPGVTEHFFRDAVPRTYSYGEPVLGSRTMLMHLIGEEEALETV
jgi:hypothetical protein